MIMISQSELNRVVDEAYRLGWRAAMDSLIPVVGALDKSLTDIEAANDRMGEILND